MVVSIASQKFWISRTPKCVFALLKQQASDYLTQILPKRDMFDMIDCKN